MYQHELPKKEGMLAKWLMSGNPCRIEGSSFEVNSLDNIAIQWLAVPVVALGVRKGM